MVRCLVEQLVHCCVEGDGPMLEQMMVISCGPKLICVQKLSWHKPIIGAPTKIWKNLNLAYFNILLLMYGIIVVACRSRIISNAANLTNNLLFLFKIPPPAIGGLFYSVACGSVLGRASNARSETKIYNLETGEFASTPPFSKKHLAGAI